MNSNIPITIVCPGPIQTPFLAEGFTEKLGEVNRRILKKNFLRAFFNWLSAITEIWSWHWNIKEENGPRTLLKIDGDRDSEPSPRGLDRQRYRYANYLSYRRISQFGKNVSHDTTTIWILLSLN